MKSFDFSGIHFETLGKEEFSYVLTFQLQSNGSAQKICVAVSSLVSGLKTMMTPFQMLFKNWFPKFVEVQYFYAGLIIELPVQY